MSKISIIIPAYNASDYLSKCIESVIAQTFSDLEILLLNDGSTDCTVDIMNHYRQIDKRIIVVNKNKNDGLSVTRNIGLNIATGDFIGFVDADDYIEKDMYSLLFSNIVKQQTDIAICGFTKVFIGSGNVCCFEKTQFENMVLTEPENIIKHHILTGNSTKRINVSVWNKLYKKELFNGIRFPEKRVYEDVFVMCKLLSICKSVCVCSDCKYYYVQNKGGISKKNGLELLDFLSAAIHRHDFLYRNYSSIKKEIDGRLMEDLIVFCFKSFYSDCFIYNIKKAQEEIAKYDYHSLKPIISKDQIYVLDMIMTSPLKFSLYCKVADACKKTIHKNGSHLLCE